MKTIKYTQIALFASSLLFAADASAVIVANFNDAGISTENVILSAQPDVSESSWRAQKIVPSANATITAVQILGHEDSSDSAVESKIRLHVCPDNSNKPLSSDNDLSGCTQFPTIAAGSPFQNVGGSLTGQNPSANSDKFITFSGATFPVTSSTPYWVVLSVDKTEASTFDFIWRCTCGSNTTCSGNPDADYTAVDASGVNPNAINFDQGTSTGATPGASWSISGTEAFYVNVIPEPSTYAAILGLAGLVGVIAVRARRK